MSSDEDAHDGGCGCCFLAMLFILLGLPLLVIFWRLALYGIL